MAGNHANEIWWQIHRDIEGRTPVCNTGDGAAKGVAGTGAEHLGGNKNVLRAERGMQVAPEVGNNRQLGIPSTKDSISITTVNCLAGKDVSCHGKAGDKLGVWLVEYLF